MQDRIKELTREAGAAFDDTFESVRSNPMYLLTPDELERFAQLVAEDCAKVAYGKVAEGYAHHAHVAIRARFGIEG